MHHILEISESPPLKLVACYFFAYLKGRTDGKEIIETTPLYIVRYADLADVVNVIWALVDFLDDALENKSLVLCVCCVAHVTRFEGLCCPLFVCFSSSESFAHLNPLFWELYK